MNQSLHRLVLALSLCAGLLDGLAGAAITMAPQHVLPLMGVPVPGAEALVYLRFVGTFVAAVGASYLWGVRDWRRSGSVTLLRSVWRLTLVFRFVAGAYVLAANRAGWLASGWLLVTFTDWTLVVVQLSLLRQGALDGT